MKKLLFVSFLIVAFGAAAFADFPATKESAEIGDATHGGGVGGTGWCTIMYYNLCSGWLWIWSGWTGGDETGVVFDLPADCNKLPGEQCHLDGTWAYYRYTAPTYGYTIDVDLWCVDANGCKVGHICNLATAYDPVERWNFFEGSCCFDCDYVAIITKWGPDGTLPYYCTTHNPNNSTAYAACPGYVVPTVPHTFYFGNPTTQYCPPQYLGDALGPSEGFVDASFTCGVGVGTEEATWGEIKNIFR